MRFSFFAALAATLLLAGVSPAGATVVSQPFTSSGSWTIPSDARRIDVLSVGGGGGGGGTPLVGGGGGGGEVIICSDIPVTAGQLLEVTVGTGGSGGDGAGSPGTAGGSSSASLDGSSICSASGGNGGASGDGSITPAYRGGSSGSSTGPGNPGGTTTTSFVGGGGGGAGGAGGNADVVSVIAGDGGAGVPGSLDGLSLFADLTGTYFGGGGGGGYAAGSGVTGNAGVGGIGGGGSGAGRTPAPASNSGTANTGGGGGGGSYSEGAPGAGGSGYLVVRYVALPTNTTKPVVSGATVVGGSLSTTRGTWTESPSSFSYKWQRCADNLGAGCADIGGATASRYTTVSADVGKYLRSSVTATNAAGSMPVYSSNYLRITAPAPIVSVAGLKAKVSQRGLYLTSSVTVPGAGKISQVATTRSGSRVKTWCRASKTALAAGAQVLKCDLGKKGRAYLKKHSLALTVKTTFAPRSGSAVTKSSKLTVKRKR